MSIPEYPEANGNGAKPRGRGKLFLLDPDRPAETSEEFAAGLSVFELTARMALLEAQSIEAARDVHRLYRDERARARELELARAQMLAYAEDIRGAVQAERLRRSELERAYIETVRALALAIDARDPYTGGHVDRVATYSVRLGRELGWDEEILKVLEVGALLHDIGKIAVPDAVLRKNGPLDEAEWALMRQHPVIGAELVGGLVAIQPSVPAVRYHHERFDGRGYPAGLMGEDIPEIARVVTLADAFDAMLTNRPYRTRLPLNMAIDELSRCAGTQFDPSYAEIFLNLLAKGQIEVIKVEGRPG